MFKHVACYLYSTIFVGLVRSTGLLKAQLLADDVAHQLRAASKDHAKAVALVSKQLNVSLI